MFRVTRSAEREQSRGKGPASRSPAEQAQSSPSRNRLRQRGAAGRKRQRQEEQGRIELFDVSRSEFDEVAAFVWSYSVQRRKISEPFVPPKPNELERAIFNSAFRAKLGT